MWFFLLLCSPVPLLTALAEAFPNFPFPIPGIKLVPLFPDHTSLLLLLDIFHILLGAMMVMCVSLVSMAATSIGFYPHVIPGS